jgi:hypothetical protein
MPEGPWAFGASPRICPATLVCALQWAACQSPTKRLASYFEESTKPERPRFGPRSFPHQSNFGEHDLFSTLATQIRSLPKDTPEAIIEVPTPYSDHDCMGILAPSEPLSPNASLANTSRYLY